MLEINLQAELLKRVSHWTVADQIVPFSDKIPNVVGYIALTVFSYYRWSYLSGLSQSFEEGTFIVRVGS